MRHPVSTLLLAALVLAAVTAADAGILWDLRQPAAPRELAATDHIRIGTLSGPWPLIVDYLGRPAVAAAGWYEEYRTADSAPSGWSTPIIGVDAAGLPAAVRSPLAPPPPDEGNPGDLASALSTLATRIEAERVRRMAVLTGSVEEQMARVGRMMQIQAAIQAETANADERTELAGLLEVQAHIQALRAYGRTPASPPMWGGVLPAAQTLYGWAEATLATPDAVTALDPASPPVAAPQWPVVAP